MVCRLLCLVAAGGLALVACSSGDDPSAVTDLPALTAIDGGTGSPTSEAATDTAARPTVSTEMYTGTGPYLAGVVTLDLGDRQAEVWYPVDAPDADGLTPEIFDSLSVFPEGMRALIPSELSGLVDTRSYRDAVPSLDAPFPVVVYSHDAGGYRQVATAYTSHLASWGFVVVSIDHVERGLAAQATGATTDVPGRDVLDVRNALAVLPTSSVGAAADLDHVGIVGHSQGAVTAARVATQVDGVDAVVMLAGGDLDDSDLPSVPALVVVAEDDVVVPPAVSLAVFERLGTPRYSVSIAGAGHNSFTDSCARIRELDGLSSLVDLLGADQVDRAENGCTPDALDPAVATAVFGHYSVAFLRTSLGVADDRATLSTDISGQPLPGVVVGPEPTVMLTELVADP